MSNLPIEIINYILAFAPIKSPSVQCIKRVIHVYNIDHNWDYTKRYRLYHIKNIMSFYDYYCHSMDEPYEYLFGPIAYNKIEDKNNNL